MAHPHLRGLRDAGEQRVIRRHGAGGPAVLPRVCLPHAPTEHLASQLHAIADAEHGDAEREQRRIAAGRVRLVDARRAPGQDDSLRCELPDAVRRDVVADDFAVDVLLADAASDQLRVLGAEVENEHALGLLRGE